LLLFNFFFFVYVVLLFFFWSNWTQSRLLFSPGYALQCREGSCQ
jgi:hypothetical protein